MLCKLQGSAQGAVPREEGTEFLAFILCPSVYDLVFSPPFPEDVLTLHICMHTHLSFSFPFSVF